VPAAEDVDELLGAAEVDGVAICSSTETHADLIVAAAEAGKAIFCEKPVSLDLAEVDRALAVVEAAGLDEFVPVSASHSGWVAIELRRRLGGDRVPNIVHMDWMVTEPSERYMDVIRKLQSPETWPEARDTLFTIWKAGVESPDIARVIAVMNEHGADMWMRSGREIEAAYTAGRSPLATYERLEPEPTTVLHVYGQPQDPAYLAAQRAFTAEHGWFGVETVPARTHFAMVETPREAAAAIERLVGSSAKPTAASARPGAG
jgi:hypothetical protein